mmetsp:Transcript_19759/g.26046  ORF Transcript_19759/g.26046 Transcript_19759/m.26046 type:complete len:225 (-) Transcript_19759:270-944(-)
MAKFGDLKAAKGLKALNEYLLTKSYIEGFALSAADSDIFSQLAGVPDQATYPHAYRWYLHIAALGGIKSLVKSSSAGPEAAPAKKGGKKKAAEPEDDDDLFGDDDEEEVDAAAMAAARKAKAAEAKKKKEKAKPVERSQLVIEIKPWEAETDLRELAKKIKDITIEGVTWGEAIDLKPVAFGIKKLIMSCVIVDDIVLMDDVTEPIEALEDFVQSVDVATMSKI